MSSDYSPAGSDTLSIIGNKNDYIIGDSDFSHEAHQPHNHPKIYNVDDEDDEPEYIKTARRQEREEEKAAQKQEDEQQQQLPQQQQQVQHQEPPKQTQHSQQVQAHQQHYQQQQQHQIPSQMNQNLYPNTTYQHLYPNPNSQNQYSLITQAQPLNLTEEYVPASAPFSVPITYTPTPVKTPNPSNRVQVFITNLNHLGEPVYTKILTKTFPPGRSNCHISNTFYDHVKEVVIKDMKQMVPYRQMLKQGIKFDMVRPTATFDAGYGDEEDHFHFNPPITADCKAKAPAPITSKDQKGNPIIDISLYYTLEILKPSPDRYIITAEDKIWLESIITIARRPVQITPTTPTTPASAPAPAIAQIPTPTPPAPSTSSPKPSIKQRMGPQFPDPPRKQHWSNQHHFKPRSRASNRRFPYRPRGPHTPPPPRHQQGFYYHDDVEMRESYNPNY